MKVHCALCLHSALLACLKSPAALLPPILMGPTIPDRATRSPRGCFQLGMDRPAQDPGAKGRGGNSSQHAAGTRLSSPSFFWFVCGLTPPGTSRDLRGICLIHLGARALGLPRPLPQGRSSFWTPPVPLKCLLRGSGDSWDFLPKHEASACRAAFLSPPQTLDHSGVQQTSLTSAHGSHTVRDESCEAPASAPGLLDSAGP